jgi:hypothetical protein
MCAGGEFACGLVSPAILPGKPALSYSLAPISHVRLPYHQAPKALLGSIVTNRQHQNSTLDAGVDYAVLHEVARFDGSIAIRDIKVSHDIFVLHCGLPHHSLRQANGRVQSTPRGSFALTQLTRAAQPAAGGSSHPHQARHTNAG